MKRKGELFGSKLREIIKKVPYDVEVSGIPLMPFITFNRDPQNHYKKLRPGFYTELIRRGVFLQPFHHGYVAYRHTDEDIAYAANMVEEAFGELKKYI